MDAGHQVRCGRWTSQMPCGCVAIGLRGAAKRGVRLSEGKPRQTRGRGDTATLTHTHGHFDIDGPSFRLSEAPQAGGLFSIHMLLTQLGIAQLLCADLAFLRHDLRSAHAAWAASSVSAGAGFTLQVHAQVAVLRMLLLRGVKPYCLLSMRTSVYIRLALL